MSEILKVIYGAPDRPLKIGELEIPCYVLEDEKRVLVQTGLIKALGMSPGTGSRSISGGDRLVKFVAGKAINPFIPNELTEMITSPIKFKMPSGGIAYGYEATILGNICDAVLEARKNGKLQKQQLHIADRCEILMRGFAQVGIIALVDEATGYQEIRRRDDLHKILEAYISKELLPWTKRFPNEFYEHLFRLQGWQYNPVSVKRPKLVGKLTEDIVYKRLPPGILDELKKRNPKTGKGHRRYKHFQFLTEDIGHPHLIKHLASVTTLMRISPNWRKFNSYLQRAHPIPNEQLLLPDMDENENDEKK